MSDLDDNTWEAMKYIRNGGSWDDIECQALEPIMTGNWLKSRPFFETQIFRYRLKPKKLRQVYIAYDSDGLPWVSFKERPGAVHMIEAEPVLELLRDYLKKEGVKTLAGLIDHRKEWEDKVKALLDSLEQELTDAD